MKSRINSLRTEDKKRHIYKKDTINNTMNFNSIPCPEGFYDHK